MMKILKTMVYCPICGDKYGGTHLYDLILKEKVFKCLNCRSKRKLGISINDQKKTWLCTSSC